MEAKNKIIVDETTSRVLETQRKIEEAEKELHSGR